MPPGPIERSGLKQTLLHNFPGSEGHRLNLGEHRLDGIEHQDSEDCPCQPIPMIWAPVSVWNEDMKRNMVTYRWMDKRTYKPPLNAHMDNGKG